MVALPKFGANTNVSPLAVVVAGETDAVCVVVAVWVDSVVAVCVWVVALASATVAAGAGVGASGAGPAVGSGGGGDGLRGAASAAGNVESMGGARVSWRW